MTKSKTNETPAAASNAAAVPVFGALDIGQLALAFVGAAIAGTIWMASRSHVDLPCSAAGGCVTVENSEYSHVALFGKSVHVALIGLAGYVAILLACFLKYAAEQGRTVKQLNALIAVFSGAGAVYSWYLQYVAHFVIGAFCPWCFSSACTITVLAILSIILLRRGPQLKSTDGFTQ